MLSKTYPTPGGAVRVVDVSSNHPVRLVNIDGTDESFINALIRLLSERVRSQRAWRTIADAATTQVVFPWNLTLSRSSCTNQRAGTRPIRDIPYMEKTFGSAGEPSFLPPGFCMLAFHVP